MHIFNPFVHRVGSSTSVFRCVSSCCHDWFCLMACLCTIDFCFGEDWCLLRLVDCIDPLSGVTFHTMDVQLQVVHRCVLPGSFVDILCVCICLVLLILKASDQTELDLLHQSIKNSASAAVYLLCILEPTWYATEGLKWTCSVHVHRCSFQWTGSIISCRCRLGSRWVKLVTTAVVADLISFPTTIPYCSSFFGYLLSGGYFSHYGCSTTGSAPLCATRFICWHPLCVYLSSVIDPESQWSNRARPLTPVHQKQCVCSCVSFVHTWTNLIRNGRA